MSKQLKKLFGEGPFPCPLEDFGKLVNIHMTEKFVVIEPILPIDLEKGCHAHESYEFIIPCSPMPASRIEKKINTFQVNKLYALNSEQFHGPVASQTGCRILGVQADKEFLCETARMVYGEKTVEFELGGISFDIEVKELIRAFIEEDVNKQTGYEFMKESISTQIIVKLLRQLRSNLSVVLREQNYIEKNAVNRVIEFFMEHYNDEYSMQDVSQIANFSHYHFIRVFKAQTGKTPYEYLTDIKIEKAKIMLKDRTVTITEICYLCGFNNPNHFANVFKRKVGVTPSLYRKLL